MNWNEFICLLKYGTTPDIIDNKRNEIAQLIPAIKGMFDYDQCSMYHQYNLWLHCVHTVLELPRGIDDDMLYLAALLHDIGKPICRCTGKKADDPYAHYYGHPVVSKQILNDEVIPYLERLDILLKNEDKERLLYYVEYHDDRVSLRIKHLRRHLQIVSLETFKKLMLLEVADAKAHIIDERIQERIYICNTWASGYADELVQNGNVIEQVPASYSERIETVKSLFGILPQENDLEKSKEERLSKK